MNRLSAACAVGMSAFAIASAAGQAQPFTEGNLVLLQVGDGTAAVTNAAQAVFLKEITTAGSPVQSIAMPTSASGANRALTQNGTATSEGFLTRSVNGEFLVLVGYDAAPLSTNPATIASTTVNRVVGRVAVDGSIDTSTAITDAVTSNFRSGVSVDGTAFWVSQAGNSTNAGVRYVTLGAPGNTSTPITATSGTATNVRVLGLFDDRLFASGATTTGPLLGVGQVGGTPAPTTGPENIVQLPGFPTASGPSSYEFQFTDANTLYIADDRTLANGGGLQKWTYDTTAQTWSLAYTLQTGLTAGIRNFTAVVNGGTTTIYALTAGSAGGGSAVLTTTDAGGTSEFTTIVPATANTWYKGIEFAPVEGTTPPSCYANCDESTATPILNVADFTCFLQRYAAGESYANCDNSTTVPTLNVADFTCFLQQYAAGCP